MMFTRTVGLVAIVLTFLLPRPAHAYLDPASGSFLLQLIVGGVAGLLVAGKLFWHRIGRAMPWRKKEADVHEERHG